MNKYFVYILQKKIKEITYVGFTNNIERRLIEHNSGKTKFTRIYKSWEIVNKEEFTREDETIAGRRSIIKLLGRI